MKTLEELYKKVMASDELKKEFTEAAKSKDGIDAWLKKHDCGATIEELGSFLKEKREGEMNDDDVEAVAGGKDGVTHNEIMCSVLVAIYCEILVVTSAAIKDKTVEDCMEKGTET